MIVYASNSGTPWLLLIAQDGDQIVFVDLFGQSLHNYPHVYKVLRHSVCVGNQILMKKPIQSANSILFGLSFFHVAHVVTTFKLSIGF